jgi:hypothetical protein
MWAKRGRERESERSRGRDRPHDRRDTAILKPVEGELERKRETRRKYGERRRVYRRSTTTLLLFSSCTGESTAGCAGTS